MEITKRNEKIIMKDFNIYEDEFSYELENWTDGGVNMIIYLDKRKDENLKQQLIEYIGNFDIDEAIEIHRQDERYKEDFTIYQSLEDFTKWVESVEKLIEKLK